jgi:rhodanese-related sulfurtransferase
LPPPGAALSVPARREEEQHMPKVVDRHEIRKLVEQGAQLVDVMSAREYREEHIPGAINLPLKTLSRESVARLDARRAVIVYCHDYQ